MEGENKNHASDVAAEPIGAVAVEDYSNEIYSIDSWPGMPLVGPKTSQEAIDRIEEAERDIDSCGGILWDDFKAMLKERRSSCTSNAYSITEKTLGRISDRYEYKDSQLAV